MTDGGFNLTNGALTVGTTSGDILTLKAASSAVAEAIVVPQTTLSKVVEFKIGAEVFKWNIDKNFAAGKKYEYNVTINRTGPTVTGTIVDWTSIGAEDVNAN